MPGEGPDSCTTPGKRSRPPGGDLLAGWARLAPGRESFPAVLKWNPRVGEAEAQVSRGMRVLGAGPSLESSGDSGLTSTVGCQGSKCWTNPPPRPPPANSVLTIMEPVQPLVRWNNLGRATSEPWFPTSEMAMIVPALWSYHMGHVCS